MESHHHDANDVIIVRNKQGAARVAMIECPVHHDVFYMSAICRVCAETRNITYAKKRCCSVISKRVPPR